MRSGRRGSPQGRTARSGRATQTNRPKPVLLGLRSERLGGWSTTGSDARTRVAQKNSRGGRGGQVVCRRLERDVTARRADRRRSARAVGLRSTGCDGNALRRRSAARRSPGARVPHEGVRNAVRITAHQVGCHREKRHIPAVGTDRRGAAVSIGGIAVESDRFQRDGRRAADRRSRTSVVHKNILCRSRNFRHAVGGRQHGYRVALVRARQRQGQCTGNPNGVIRNRSRRINRKGRTARRSPCRSDDGHLVLSGG